MIKASFWIFKIVNIYRQEFKAKIKSLTHFSPVYSTIYSILISNPVAKQSALITSFSRYIDTVVYI